MLHFSSTVTLSARRQSDWVMVVRGEMEAGWTIFWAWESGEESGRVARWREVLRRRGQVSMRRIKGESGVEGWM